MKRKQIVGSLILALGLVSGPALASGGGIEPGADGGDAGLEGPARQGADADLDRLAELDHRRVELTSALRRNPGTRLRSPR